MNSFYVITVIFVGNIGGKNNNAVSQNLFIFLMFFSFFCQIIDTENTCSLYTCSQMQSNTTTIIYVYMCIINVTFIFFLVSLLSFLYYNTFSIDVKSTTLFL